MKKFSLTILLLTMLAICAVSFADTVQIGTGTATTSYLPINGFYGYTYSQQIYTQAQINKAGNITKLRFFYVSGTITNSKDWVIYMGHTTKTTFSSTTVVCSPTISFTFTSSGLSTSDLAINSTRSFRLV